MKGWPFSEAARKPIDLDDYIHQNFLRVMRDVDDKVSDVLLRDEEHEGER